MLLAGAVEGSGASAEARAVASADASDENPCYAFASDTPLLGLAPGVALAPGETPARDQVVPLDAVPGPGETCWYETSSYDAAPPADGGWAPATTSGGLAPYVVPRDGHAQGSLRVKGGRCVVVAGTPRSGTGDEATLVEKTANPSAGAPYVRRVSASADGDGVALVARLGNNGALVLAEDEGGDPGDSGGGDAPGGGGGSDADGPDGPNDPAGGGDAGGAGPDRPGADDGNIDGDGNDASGEADGPSHGDSHASDGADDAPDAADDATDGAALADTSDPSPSAGAVALAGLAAIGLAALWRRHRDAASAGRSGGSND